MGTGSPEPVAEILQSHPPRHALPPQFSPPNYNQHQSPPKQPQPPPQQQLQQLQQQRQQHQQQQQQHQMYHQQQPVMNQRQPEMMMKTSVPVNASRQAGPNADSPYSSRQTASSTLVYSSQPNAYGKANVPHRSVSLLTVAFSLRSVFSPLVS